jgi:hypothetical protein
MIPFVTMRRALSDGHPLGAMALAIAHRLGDTVILDRHGRFSRRSIPTP